MLRPAHSLRVAPTASTRISLSPVVGDVQSLAHPLRPQARLLGLTQRGVGAWEKHTSPWLPSCPQGYVAEITPSNAFSPPPITTLLLCQCFLGLSPT